MCLNHFTTVIYGSIDTCVMLVCPQIRLKRFMIVRNLKITLIGTFWSFCPSIVLKERRLWKHIFLSRLYCGHPQNVCLIERDSSAQWGHSLSRRPSIGYPWVKRVCPILNLHGTTSAFRDLEKLGVDQGYIPFFIAQVYTIFSSTIGVHVNWLSIEQSIHIYTDGSKSEQRVGFGIYSEQLSISHKLLATSSIYTAELYAILETLNILNEHIGNRFTIFSDSLSCLQGIQQLNSNHFRHTIKTNRITPLQ